MVVSSIHREKGKEFGRLTPWGIKFASLDLRSGETEDISYAAWKSSRKFGSVKWPPDGKGLNIRF